MTPESAPTSPLVERTRRCVIGDDEMMDGPYGSRRVVYAALCGASPVDASSGKQIRHRLNRGGDRQANAALWTIAMTRLRIDHYLQGRSTPYIS